MKRGIARTALGLALAALAVGGPLSAYAQPIKRTRPIQFSEPRSDTAATNRLNDFAEENKNTLRTLQEGMGRSFDVTGQDASSTQPLPVAPPISPGLHSRKIQELRDREKNWVFVNPEEVPTGLTPEEMMRLSEFENDGLQKGKTTVLERYLEKFGREGMGETNSAMGDLGDSNDRESVFGEDLREDETHLDPVKASVREAEQSLRRTMSEEPTTKLMPELGEASVMPGLFDTPNAKTAADKAQELRASQFRQMLQADLPKSAVSALPTLPNVSGGLGRDYSSSLGNMSGMGGLIPGSSAISSPAPAVTRPTPGLGSAALSSAGMPAAPSLSSAPRITPAPLPASRPAVAPMFLDGNKRKF